MDIKSAVKERYGKAAMQVIGGGAPCCGGNSSSAGCGDPITSDLYDEKQTEELPETAVLGSLGCGNPTALAQLNPGETVLDLGSGGGIDVLLSARRVGSMGRVFGLDMTDEMLALAAHNIAAAGATNIELLKGHIEAIPLPAGSIDVVISNCVVNLAADKRAVFREIARVLRPGGRIGITDIVADDSLSPEQRAERGSYTGCIAGALSFSELEAGMGDAGLVEVSVTPTHDVADGMHSAIIRATKPADAVAARPTIPAMVAGQGCCGGPGCC
jgi:SAM-dependent methyltransferase